MLHLTRMTPLATAASSLPSLQELQAFQVGQNVSAEFRTFAEEGDLSELLVRVPLCQSLASSLPLCSFSSCLANVLSIVREQQHIHSVLHTSFRIFHKTKLKQCH